MAERKYQAIILASQYDVDEVMHILDRLGADFYLDVRDEFFRVSAVMSKSQVNMYLMKKVKNESKAD